MVYGLPVGSKSFHDDPLFIAASADPLSCDFHLTATSPCVGRGTPAGTDIGAYQDGPSPVQPATWGGIKALFQ